MPNEISPFSFMQFSDVHLDSRFSTDRLGLSPSQRHERAKEILEIFDRALEEAVARAVEAILICGDLWENESVTGETVQHLISAFGNLGNIPVIITPGNRDCYRADSPYNPEYLSVRDLGQWPDNVFIFRTTQFSAMKVPGRPDVSVTGRAFDSADTVYDRLLQSLAPRHVDCPIKLLMYHGSYEGYQGGDAGRPNKTTAPFSLEELIAQGFTYAALGHYHDVSDVSTPEGIMLGAYAGAMVARSFDELGPRCALFGTIMEDGGCSLDPLEVDVRRMLIVGADVSGLSHDHIIEEISANLEDQGGRPEDMIYLHLEGKYGTGSEPKEVFDELRDRYYHVRLHDNTRPDYLAERFDERTTEWKFIESMLELKRNTERDSADWGADADPGSGAVVEDALYYGLEALKLKKVTVRDVD